MAQIAPTTDRILGGKRYIYKAQMRDQDGNSTQGILDIGRVSGGLIQISGVSVGVDSIKLKGTTDPTIPSTELVELQLDTALEEATIVAGGVTTNALVPDRGLAKVVGIGTSGASVSSNAIKTDCFVKVSKDIAQIQLELTGVTSTAVSAKFFGQSV